MADRRLWITIGANVDGLMAGVAKAKQGVQDFDKELQKNAARRQGIDELGNTFGKVGLAAAAGVGLAAKSAMDWETAWAGVTKTVEGSSSVMAGIEDQLREMARTMPATHQEIAAVAQAAGALGVATPDVVDFTRTMIMLGEATDDLTADQAATSMAQLMNVMQTAPEDVDNLANALVRLGNNGASTEGQILQLAQNLAGAGETVGLTESEVLGIANALASVGIEAEAGGSAVSRILMDMAKSAKTGSKELATWAKTTGLSVSEFKKAMQESPAEVFDKFTKGLGKINAEGGDVYTLLDQLGQSDIRVTRALLGMANAGDLLSDSLADSADAYATGTDALDEYEKRSETAAAKVQVAWNGIKDNLIDIGADALPVIKDLSEAVSDLTGWFTDLPDGVKSSTLKFGALLTVIGGSGFVLSRAVTGWTNLANSINNVVGNGERLSRSGLFARGGAALGGLAMISAAEAAGDANQAFEDLANIGGGALMGFAVGGPIGGAVGGLAGLLKTLRSRSDEAREAQARLKESAKEVAATLDEQSGAITKLTEATAKKVLTEEGVYKKASEMGLNLDDVTKAYLGDPDAQERVNKAMREYLEIRQDAISEAERGRELGDDGGLPDPEKIAAASKALKDAREDLKAAEAGADIVGGAIGANAEALAARREQIRLVAQEAYDSVGAFAAQAVALGDAAGGAVEYAGVLEKIPPEVMTDVQQNGVEASKSSIDALAAAYNLTPEQVLTVLAAQDLASGKLRVVDGQLVDLDGRVVTAKVDVITAQAKAAVDSIVTSLNNLPLLRTVTIQTRNQTASAEGGAIPRAAGGSIVGPGTGTSDSIAASGPGNIAYRLSNGEHVWTAAEVAAVGGQAAMYRMRAAVRAQANALKFANGGSIGRAAAPVAVGNVLPPGSRFRLVGADLIELVDARVERGRATQTRYDGATTRSRTGRGR